MLGVPRSGGESFGLQGHQCGDLDFIPKLNVPDRLRQQRFAVLRALLALCGANKRFVVRRGREAPERELHWTETLSGPAAACLRAF